MTPGKQLRWMMAAGLLTLALATANAWTARAEPVEPEPASLEALEAVQGLPLPSLPADATPWLVPAASRSLIDDFEGSPWPDRSRWVQVLDLNGNAGAGEYTWAPRSCHPATGARALWSVGGGHDGDALACGAPYPDDAAASAMLALDLSGKNGVVRLGLTFDILADAAPNEGMFVNYVVFNAQGAAVERRTIYSATGRPGAWARGVFIDLMDLRDRLDGSWRKDLRGHKAFLEFLFISLPNQPDGEGIFLDNLYLDSEDRIVVVTPSSPNQTVGCTSGTDCGSLSVRGFVDNRCDGRYQPGLDTPVRGARVEVTAGSVNLATTLSKSGNASFRVPMSGGVEARFAVPDGYAMCPGSPQTVAVGAAEFGQFHRKQLQFRIQRQR